MSTDPRIKVSVDGPVGTVLIDRAEKRNALDLPMWRALGAALDALGAVNEIGCLVIRGAGTLAFSAGADIAAFARDRGTGEQQNRYNEDLHHAMQAIRACTHPVVAAISGWCMGGGAGIASMCDFRVGGEGMRLGVPARERGIWYAHAELDPILSVVGYAIACELMIEGRVFSGREAYEKGLISRVVPDDAVFGEAEALARRICEGAPLSNRYHKRALQALRGPIPVSAEEQAASQGFAQTADYREATLAFTEKRRPVFKGA
ncbi:enoyl-CoA hydratase/carnithine racemase [Humitalea rosea]|uniref:Enoyl-CoA hydratase/carnithine racemase n=1 Tax=Humitalea rosea TaxID=990373 RepID=A0A2W7I9K8_9PROT|nr:enoyl-CoA hydratase/isomerase family protein [Humitalea rosea]PZW42212.1 enoyl-CoA hydratase/carnithine racemase [Humitalea rosea]